MLDYFPLPTATSVAIVAGWFIFQGLLQIYAPGQMGRGDTAPGRHPAQIQDERLVLLVVHLGA